MTTYYSIMHMCSNLIQKYNPKIAVIIHMDMDAMVTIFLVTGILFHYRLLKVNYLEDSLCGSFLVGSDLNGGLM